MARRFLLLLAVLSAIAVAARAGEPLLADLSEHLVKIDTGFTGAKVLLFGAIEGRGEVVVIIRGPRAPVTIRRKGRVAGVWANRDGVTFENAFSFYQVMASIELDEWLPLEVRERHQIGVEYLKFKPRGEISPAKEADFHAALVRSKQRLGHYGLLEGNVGVIGGRLFRTEVIFPANVPTGIYTAEVLLLRDGKVASAQRTPLYVSKSGLEADIFRLAHEHPKFHGLIAILIAVAAGVGANAAFSRR